MDYDSNEFAGVPYQTLCLSASCIQRETAKELNVASAVIVAMSRAAETRTW